MIGQVRINSAKIGGKIDLLNGKSTIFGFDVFETLDDPFGSPSIKIYASDAGNELSGVTGSYDENDLELSFTHEESGKTWNYRGNPYSANGLGNREGEENAGFGKSKTVCLDFVQPELFKAQRKQDKSFGLKPTTEHIKKTFKEIIETDGKVSVLTPSEPREGVINRREHVVDYIQKTMMESAPSSKEDKSASYVCYQQWKPDGQKEIIITTLSERLEQQPVAKFKENYDNNSSGVPKEQHQNSILYSSVDPFWSFPRVSATAAGKSFNTSTGVTVDQEYRGTNNPKKSAYINPASYMKKHDVICIECTANNGQPHNTLDAKVKRAKWTPHSAQGSCEIEVPANPNVYLGCVVEVEIPTKTDDGKFGTEPLIAKKCLVTAIRQKIKPAGEEPRHTMVLTCVSFGMEQGGNSA